MNQEHIVKSFDQDLAQIEKLIMEMGGLVEAQILDAAAALKTRDVEKSEEVVKADKRIDALEMDVDSKVIRVLALRQPKAQDLRSVVGVLKVAANLERIGDYAKNISKRTGVIAEFDREISGMPTVDRMAQMVHSMVRDVVDAYVERDEAKAEEVRIRDTDVDQIYNTLFRELLTYMMEDPRNISPSMHLLFIAKNLERMGDHATSIAEQTHYLVSGVMPDLDRPKSDKTSYMNVVPE